MSRAIELLLADQVTTKKDFKVDWKEDSKLDFVLQEDFVDQEISVEQDVEVDASAKANATDIFVGTGNKANHYLVAKNETQGLEVGIKVHKRGGPGYAVPVSETEDGVFELEVPAEPLVTVSGKDPRRTRWSYAFSIATGLNEVNSSISDFGFELDVDFDPSDDEFQADSIKLRFGNGAWTETKTGKVILVPDASFTLNGGDRKVLEQNILNIGFGTLDVFRPIDLDPQWAEKEGFYNFTLRATIGGKTVLENKIKVHTDPEFTWTL